MHVVDAINLTIVVQLPSDASLERVIKNGREILRRAEEVARLASVPAETGLLISDTLGHRIPERIAHDALTVNADVIVICTHGRSGLSQFLPGSVTEGVMRMAITSVPLIR